MMVFSLDEAESRWKPLILIGWTVDLLNLEVTGRFLLASTLAEKCIQKLAGSSNEAITLCVPCLGQQAEAVR